MRMEAIKAWAKWASGKNVVWRYQSDGGRVREANTVWLDLAPTRIIRIGTDEVCYKDIDNEAGDATYPMQMVYVGLRKLQFELRAMSRSQEHTMSAWEALTNVHSKAFSRYAIDKYFQPYNMSLAELGDVFNMPLTKIFDMRIEDVALFEFEMNTVLTDEDAHELGTYIETILISSDVQHDGGETSLPDSVQLDNEVF